MILNRKTFRFFPYKIRQLFNLHIQSEIQGKTFVSPLRKGRAIEGHWYLSWKTEAIKRLCKTIDGAFIDIGANLGQTLLDHHLADINNEYIGFEPNPHCVHYLTEIIEANSLSNYKILPIGLSDETKILTLYSRKGNLDDVGASVIGDLRPTWELSCQYISCYKFDEVCQTLEIEQIALMKIDVEGFELEVLKGMQISLKNLKPVILCEVLFPEKGTDPSVTEIRNKGIVELLNGLGYNILQLIKSPDDVHIIEVKRIEAFSNEFLTEKNMTLYDYLFVPAEEEMRVVEILLKKSSVNTV